MGLNGIGSNRFNTWNFNELMNGTAGRRAPKKETRAGVSLYAGNSNALSAGAFGPDRTKDLAAGYGKAFISGLEQQREAQKQKSQNAGKKDPDYNHRKFSNKLKNAKRSSQMTSVLADIRATIADLKAKQATGEYDEEDIAAAILHAELMEAAAMKRMENLETEEMAERKVKREELEELMEPEEGEDAGAEALPGDAGAAADPAAAQAEEQLQAEIDAEMQAMMEEMKRIQEEMAEQMAAEMEEMMAEMEEENPLQALDDMAKVLGASASTEEDIDEMKKKHRAAEDMAVARADMEFLKLKFDRLQREREALKSGAAGMGGRGNSGSNAPAPAGFADGAKIITGAVRAEAVKTAHAASSAGASGSFSGSASTGTPSVSVSGGNIDISG